MIIPINYEYITVMNRRNLCVTLYNFWQFSVILGNIYVYLDMYMACSDRRAYPRTSKIINMMSINIHEKYMMSINTHEKYMICIHMAHYFQKIQDFEFFSICVKIFRILYICYSSLYRQFKYITISASHTIATT